MSKTKLKCTKCTKLKTINNFHKASSLDRKYAYWCKECKKSSKKVLNVILQKENLSEKINCTKCNLKKEKREFSLDKTKSSGVSSRCKKCRLSDKKSYKTKLTEEDLVNLKRRCTSCEVIKPFKEFYKDKTSKTGIKAKCKSCTSVSFQNSDDLTKLKRRLRTRLSNFITYNKIKITKKDSSLSYLGCSFEHFKSHIEKQFSSGMTWENHSKEGWHIDHVIPLSSAKTEQDLYKLFNYKNTQPLWATDNLSKNAKLDWTPN
jgi:hypothetical protein